MVAFALPVAALSFAIAVSFANAFPFGAGQCPAGVLAVGGPHSPVSAGSLAAGGLQLTLDSNSVNPGASTSFVTGKDHVLTVTSSSPFRGILLRLGSSGGVDTTAALAVQNGDTSLRLASDTCIPSGAGGVTHADSSGKNSASVTLRLNSAASGLPLDITVVFDQNTAYFSHYSLNAVAGASAPPPPTSTVKNPVAPVRPPVVSPTPPGRPVQRPYASPVRRPEGSGQRPVYFHSSTQSEGSHANYPVRHPSGPTFEKQPAYFPSSSQSEGSPANYPVRQNSGPTYYAGGDNR